MNTHEYAKWTKLIIFTEVVSRNQTTVFSLSLDRKNWDLFSSYPMTKTKQRSGYTRLALGMGTAVNCIPPTQLFILTPCFVWWHQIKNQIFSISQESNFQVWPHRQRSEYRVPYARKYWCQKTLTNSGLSRFDKIKVDELLGVPRHLLNVFQFN